MALKSILKSLKLHESTISTVLGFVVIVIVGLLVVNFFRDSDTGSTFPEGANNQVAEERGNTHTVSEGDSLWTISEEYYGTGFEWETIMKANDINNPNDIEEGQVLVIPEIDSQDNIAQASPTPTPVVTQQPESTNTPSPVLSEEDENSAQEEIFEGETYTVKRGDNLWEIAETVYGDGYRWVDIANANDLVNPGLIHAGNILVLPN